MKSSRSWLSQSLSILACAVATAAAARAQDSYLLRDLGKLREYALAADEMHVVRPSAAAEDLTTALQATEPGATVLEAARGRALVQSSQPRTPASRAAAIQRALPGARAEAVLYPKDGPRTELTRRIATAQVLVPVPAGQSAAQIAANAGASDVQLTNAPGYAMLRFSDGFAALEAVAALEARGLRPEPQLRRQRERLFTPNDVFFPNQWHLRNIGQGGGLFGADANVTPVWDITRGAGVTISIVDDGLETTHPDLSPNCPAIATGFHYDFNGDDNNPAPEPSALDRHGTAVGGVAAARGNNSIGVSGAAPESQLVGIRLISGPSTDAEEAQALFWKPTGLDVAVSNNSWGPRTYYAGADTLVKQALRDAAVTGRGGLGQITLFSAGNSQEDSRGARDANGNSFANSRFVMAIGAVNNFGVQSTYSQRGANLLVSAPSNDPFNPQPRLGIWTTDNVGTSGYNPGAGEPSAAIDPQRAYTNSFGGTSSASPLTAGAVALMVAAAPTLGWRDVHEIVAATATQVDSADPGWVINGGGFKFSHRYGGGMVNANLAVVRGMNWQNLGPEVMQQVVATGLPFTIPDNNNIGASRSFDFSAQPNLRVERVELLLRVQHNSRSDLDITLTSPAGTVSRLSELRPRQTGTFDDDIDIEDNGAPWSFTSTQSWGENSSGVWTLTARDLRTGNAGTVTSAIFRIYGTTSVQERVILDTSAVSVSEADGTATLNVVRHGSAAGAFTVDVITAAQGTATAGADFTAVTQTLSFAEDETEQEITIPILQDTAPEAPESIFIALRNPVGAALGGVSIAQVTIVDDETRPVIATAPDPTATEFPADPGEIVIARAAADPTPLTVNLAISGSATNGTDYNATIGTTNQATLPTSVTIPALSSSVTLRIRPVDDSFFEGAETVIVGVLPGFDYDVGTQNEATVTIVDNERPAVTVEAAVAFVSERSPTPVNFVVRRSNTDTTPLIVRLQVEGTARSGVNYVEIPNQVEIPGNAAHVDVPLQPINDSTYDPLKSVVVKIFPSQDYAESFSTRATINIAEDDPVPDATRPTATIASPRAAARINAGTTVVASGTARDNKAVSRVFYSVNDGPRKVATGTTAWTADLTADLIPGPNRLSVQSEDAEGNRSVAALVTFNSVQARSLTVSTKGNGAPGAGGTVSRPAVVEAGQTYTLTATPAAGFVFSGWSGTVGGLSRTLTFTMPNADANLTAAFVSDPFLAGVQGTYTGPVTDTPLAVHTSGLLQTSVTARGALTGTLFIAGTRYGIRGEFNGQGRFRTSIARTNAPPLQLDLTLALSGPLRRITGTIVTTDFSSDIVADRAAFGPGSPYTAAQPRPEYYTFVIPAESGSPAFQQPAGTGFGTMTIDALGHARWTATLPDQSTISGSAPLTSALRAPLFGALYAGRGLLLGEITINKAAATTDFTGTVDWIKPENPRDRTFPLGFTRLGAPISGSLYTAPPRPATQTVFNVPPVTAGLLDLTNGNIMTTAGVPSAISATFKLGLDHRLTVNGTPVPFGLTVTIDPALGTFTGSFVDAKFPIRTLRPFRGVILQKAKLGWGGFVGGTVTGAGLQTGTVKLNPVPPPTPPVVE